MLELFPKEQRVGVFMGFKKGGLEFHANLTLPYKNEFQNIPMIGQFLLIQLENEDEAILGRISSLSSEGELASSSGEDYNIRAMQDNITIPEDIRERYLKYKIDIRVLGVIRVNREKNKIIFVASHRRLPHVGSVVAFPNQEVLKEIVGNNIEGAVIGYFALGEFIYSGDSKEIQKEDWMQIKYPEIPIKFPIESLISRRSFIFARAGFGKSNLNKLLFSELYKNQPIINNKPVGTIIFDPDGEYFWPDNKGRPGLCDVEHLRDKLVVFTNRESPSLYYKSFVLGGVKLDIRRFKPSDVISLALPEEKQDQQNINKLKSLTSIKWAKLVDLIDKEGFGATNEKIKEVIGYKKISDIEINAIRSNMNTIISLLHDKNNNLFELLKKALSDGKLCIVDLSQLRGKAALILASLIVRNIFNHNAEQFTKRDSKLIPTLLVIEEAQSILNDKSSAAEPFIEWVKEGRKYDLGTVMITQQPGSIPNEILSQGDNWFIMHLLSANDLQTVKSANAHFSDDILSVLLNEAIPGQSVYWSSVNQLSYPISFKVLSFEKLYKVKDKNYLMNEIDTYVTNIKKNKQQGPDILEMRKDIIEKMKNNHQLYKKMKEGKVSWGHITKIIESLIPDNFIGDKNNEAYHLVKDVLNECFSDNWESFKENGKTYVRCKNKDNYAN